MSKSKNSKMYQTSHGEDLAYENYIFGEDCKNEKLDQKLRYIEERRMQRHIKQLLLEQT